MTIERFSRMEDSGDFSLMARWHIVPKKACLKQYARFKDRVALLFNGEKIFDSDRLRLSIFVRIGLLRALYIGLGMRRDSELLEFYEANFGRPYKAASDLDVVATEIKRLNGKLKEISDTKTEEEPKKFDFEMVVLGVEQVLERGIDRGIKLYQFKRYYDKAAQLAQAKNSKTVKNAS